MPQELLLSVFEIVGNPLCVASDDGQRVHDRIAAAIKENTKVRLSFLNVQSLTSAFLNAAVGQLYGEFSEDIIRQNLAVEQIEKDDLGLLKRVVDTAKEYFKDPDRVERLRSGATGGE